jgi:hypothetical protein
MYLIKIHQPIVMAIVVGIILVIIVVDMEVIVQGTYFQIIGSRMAAVCLVII